MSRPPFAVTRALIALAVLAAGCKPKPLAVEADKPSLDTSDLRFKVSFSRGGKAVAVDGVEAGGESASHPGESHWFKLERRKLPVGKSKVEVTAKLEKQKATAEVEIDNPLTLKAERGKVLCDGARFCVVDVKKKGDKEVFEIHQFSEAGAVVEAAGTKIPHEKSAVFDPLKFATGSRLKTLLVTVPVKVQYPGATAVEASITDELYAPELVAKQLRAVKNGPLHLAGESKAPGPARSGLLVYGGDLTAHGAPIQNNAQAEILGIVDITSERRASCGTYTNGSVSRTLERIEWDTSVSVYERRTGKLLGQRAFRAPPIGCSATASKDSYSFYSKPDDATMAAFLKTFLQ